MAPRKRSKAKSDLPPNLYSRTKGGVTYYEYRRPDTGKRFPMGKNKAEAISAAEQLNPRFMKGQELITRVTGKASIKSIALDFEEQMIDADVELAASTKKEKKYKIKRIIKDLGHIAISAIKTPHIVEFLSALPRFVESV